MGESVVVKELQEIATRLTGDPEVQRDLMHEMFLHLVRMRTSNPDQPLSWYLRSCEFHARNHLKLDGRSGAPLPDALGTPYTTREQAADATTGRTGTDALGTPYTTREQAAPISESGQADATPVVIQGERITSDALNLILPLLSEMRQRVLFLLMKGCGVRETGRQLGITHPAVIKHRKKIARIAHELFQESEGIGVAVTVRDGTKEDVKTGRTVKTVKTVATAIQDGTEQNGNGNGSPNSIGIGNGSGA